MKTTLNLDEALMRQAKRVALERGITLTQVVEEALEATVLRGAERSTYQLGWEPVRGRRAPAVDVADRDALIGRMEERP
jgi:hypothetical protein